VRRCLATKWRRPNGRLHAINVYPFCGNRAFVIFIFSLFHQTGSEERTTNNNNQNLTNKPTEEKKKNRKKSENIDL